MNPELEAIKQAMDNTNGDRDIDQARALADAYVTAHPDEFGHLQTMPIETVVATIDVFREAGDDDSQWRVEAWLLHRYEPQTIGGPVTARIRVPGSEN